MSKILDDLAKAKENIFMDSNKIITEMVCGKNIFKAYFKSINNLLIVKGEYGTMPISGELMGIKVSVNEKLPSHAALLVDEKGEILEVIVMEDLKWN